MASRKNTASPPSRSGPRKDEVHAALVEALRAAVAKMASVARDTAHAVTHEDNRSEGSKDMRSTEQSYIARGQAMRTEELAEALQRAEAFQPPAYDAARPIGAGALLRAEVDGDERWVYVLAWGGGTELRVGPFTVMVVAPSSPVGRQLIGKQAGDAFELQQGGKPREWVIDSVG